jgi:hypothetical protein
MNLKEKTRAYMVLELDIPSPSEADVQKYIDSYPLDFDTIEEFEDSLDEWGCWGNVFNKANTVTFSINDLSKMNPTLCIAALQGITHVEDGLYILIDAVKNEFKVKIEDEYVGVIAINNGHVVANCEENYLLLVKAQEHLNKVFKGLWE